MGRLRQWIPICSIILLSLLFFYKLSFTDMILARGDTYTYFYPYWDARNIAMGMGELPLWTSDIFMGVPLLANPQLGTFYPPNWLSIPLSAPDAIRVSILMHIIWSALGVFVLFRQTISKMILPAFVASIVFALSGYISAHVEQINQLQGLSWLPWLLYIYHQAQSSKHRLRWSLLLAIAWALQIFSGHTQTVFMTGIALGIYALSLSDLERPLKSIAGNLALIAFPAIIAVLLALPQLLPTLELTGMSNRGGGFDANQATGFFFASDLSRTRIIA